MTATGLLLVFVGVIMLLSRWRYLRKIRTGEPPQDTSWRSFWRRVTPQMVSSDAYYDRIAELFWIPALAVLLLGIATLLRV